MTMALPGEDCDFAPVTTFGATASGGPSEYILANDIFVRFEATSPRYEVDIIPIEGDLDIVAIELFSACGEEPLDDFIVIDFEQPTASGYQLTVGETYYLRVFSRGEETLISEAEFDLCVRGYEPPSTELTCGDVFTDLGGEGRRLRVRHGVPRDRVSHRGQR